VDDLLRPLGVLLLPAPLEEFALRGEVDALRHAGRMVIADPPRVSYATQLRLPRVAAEILAQTQAKRLLKALRRNGDRPAVVVIFEPQAYLLARAIVVRAPGTELWYRPSGEGDPELHDQATARANAILEPGQVAPELAGRLRELTDR
jgi:hypothetical protein